MHATIPVATNRRYFGKITGNTTFVVKMQRSLWPHSGTMIAVVLRAERLVHVLEERLATRAARRALRHRVRRRIESAERQHVHLAEQVGRRPFDELLPQLIVAHPAV